MSDVFVSYRSVDARFGAAATYELLATRFGKHRLFLDNQSIPAGASYSSELDRALESMRVLLVLIGPAWLVNDPESPGRLVIERNDDWVRREIRSALQRHVPLVPVLLDGSALPDPALPPPDVRAIVGHQAVEVRHRHLGADVGRLADHLATLIPGMRSSADTPPLTRPHHLPHRLARLVGRSQQIAQLDQSMRDATEGDTPITVLSGIPGVGKTTLAIYWAHRVADRFPDGQLHVNLRGFDRHAAVDPGEALYGFLTAFGVTPRAIPDTLDARAALYRSLLARRRILVLLDNAATAEQIRPLLPATSSCFVLVTSRTRLHGLAVRESAHHIQLEQLTTSDAHLLLAQRLGGERLVAEPVICEQLLQWCAGLPLALGIVGALVDQRHGSLSQVVRELADERNRLDALEIGDTDLDLRTVFSWSYQRLSPAARRLFRLLGVHPGPDISRESCIVLCEDTHARRVLTELLGSSLVTEYTSGRLGLHDLLRVYSAEQADADDTERSSTLRRIADHYLRLLTSSARWLDSSLSYRATSPTQDPGEDFDSYADAMSWCLAENAVLLAVVRLAARYGLDAYVWRVAWMWNAFLRRTGRRQQRVDVHRAAVDAAQRAGDRLAWARSSQELGIALARAGIYDEADGHLSGALAAFEVEGDRLGRLRTLLAYTRVLDVQQRHEDALRHAWAALALTRPDDTTVCRADVLINLGIQLTMLDRYEDAQRTCGEALDLYENLGHLEGQANCLLTIGMIHQGRREYTTALSCYERSSLLDRQLGDRYWEAMCMERLGEVRDTLGQPDTARRCWHDALNILESLQHPDAARLRKRLTA